MKTKQVRFYDLQQKHEERSREHVHLESYLRSTHKAFVAAVEHSAKLGTLASGVLAGPRVRV